MKGAVLFPHFVGIRGQIGVDELHNVLNEIGVFLAECMEEILRRGLGREVLRVNVRAAEDPLDRVVLPHFRVLLLEAH